LLENKHALDASIACETALLWVLFIYDVKTKFRFLLYVEISVLCLDLHRANVKVRLNGSLEIED
jgi:hypothetical protein